MSYPTIDAEPEQEDETINENFAAFKTFLQSVDTENLIKMGDCEVDVDVAVQQSDAIEIEMHDVKDVLTLNMNNTSSSFQEPTVLVEKQVDLSSEVNEELSPKSGTLMEEMKLRDTGASCITKRGKGSYAQEKFVEDGCQCKRRCFESLTPETREHIFTGFWSKSDYNAQNAYILSCLKVKDIKQRTNQTILRRKHIDYIIRTYEDNEEIKICKTAFLSVHGLHNSQVRLENIVKKIIDRTVVDKRGNYLCDPEQINNVIEFINKLPRYKMNDNTIEYMSMEYDIDVIYGRYVDLCEEASQRAVYQDKFRGIFDEKFDIKFLNSDRCFKCEHFDKTIKEAAAKGDVEEESRLKSEKEAHDNRVNDGRAALQDAFDKTLLNMYSSKRNINTISFAMQQPLPMPKVLTGDCFFKKKLWTHNFSVHHYSNVETTHFYLWNETDAKMGSDEMTSCLFRYFLNTNFVSETLYVFSYQKSWTFVLFWLCLIEMGRFDKIIHVFVEVGHEILSNDRDFDNIAENARGEDQFIYTTEQWLVFISELKKPTPMFNITRMSQSDFLSFSNRMDHIILPKYNKDGTPFSLSDVVTMKLSVNHPFEIMTKRSFNEEYTAASLLRSGLHDVYEHIDEKYEFPLTVDSERLKDVMSCLKQVPPEHRTFYRDTANFQNSEEDDNDA